MAGLLAGCGGGKPAVEESPAFVASPSPSVTVADARWEGKWQFDYSLVKLEGVAENETSFTLGSRIKRVWEVTPGCDDGPCNSVILSSDPDQPAVEPSKLVVVYDSGAGVYRITQKFPPEAGQSCKGDNGRNYASAFEATNVVEVKPTNFELSDGRAIVSEATSTKTTTFAPGGAAADVGGSCIVKTATWEGPVTRLLS